MVKDLFTMYKIGQDDFSDVKVPDTPRQPQSSKKETWT